MQAAKFWFRSAGCKIRDSCILYHEPGIEHCGGDNMGKTASCQIIIEINPNKYIILNEELKLRLISDMLLQSRIDFRGKVSLFLRSCNLRSKPPR